jgi:hypothetical protein
MQSKPDEMCLMFFFFLLVLDVVEVNVTDKPHARTEDVSGEQPVVRTISPINENNGSNFIQGHNRITNYPISYHGGPVMTSPGIRVFLFIYYL